VSDADDSGRPTGDRFVPSRRQFLRATAVAAPSVAVGGCLGDSDPVTATRTVAFDESPTPQTATSPTATAQTAYSEQTLARRTPDDSAFDQPSLTVGCRQGVATDRLVATRDGERVAVAEFSLGVYETALGEQREGYSYDLYWLWCSARPTDETTRLSETVTHVQLGDESDLTVYGVTDADETGAAVAPERTGTDDDEFGLRWRGETSGTVVATGHCVGRRAGERQPVEWGVSLSIT
jgi:hypothetical protein